MEEQEQSPAFYLSEPDEPDRNRSAVPVLAAVCVVLAALLGVVAAHRSPLAATSKLGTESPRSVITRDAPSLAGWTETASERVRSTYAKAQIPVPTTSPAHQARVAASRESTPGFGCSYALEWLAGHAAPGFRFECPGYALGHQAMTCDNVPGVCSGARLIVIADPCPAAYMNEANNSWILAGLRTGSLDPYGYCR